MTSDLAGLAAKENGIDENVSRETLPSGSSFLNKFMVRRKDNRGDIVASMAWWGFWALLSYMFIAGVFGGTKFDIAFGAWFKGSILIPAINAGLVTGLISPILMHVVKSTIEGLKNVASNQK